MGGPACIPHNYKNRKTVTQLRETACLNSRFPIDINTVHTLLLYFSQMDKQMADRYTLFMCESDIILAYKAMNSIPRPAKERKSILFLLGIEFRGVSRPRKLNLAHVTRGPLLLTLLCDTRLGCLKTVAISETKSSLSLVLSKRCMAELRRDRKFERTLSEGGLVGVAESNCVDGSVDCGKID